jgi:hypothetical protein
MANDVCALEFELVGKRDEVARRSAAWRVDIQGKRDLEIFVEVVADPEIATLGVILIDGDSAELTERLWELKAGRLMDERSHSHHATRPGTDNRGARAACKAPQKAEEEHRSLLHQWRLTDMVFSGPGNLPLRR